jgi:single-stranded-DNA-specific exonuclease
MSSYQLRGIPTNEEKSKLASYPDLLQDLLVARGITTQADAEFFLQPTYEAMHDPFLIRGMDRAVLRILKAIQNNERIALWTDYDCDGIPAGTILHDFFKKIGYQNFENYIPHRHVEGYGVNTKGLSQLSERGATLVITADVGITDVEAVDHANELGMDVIITDHHLPNGELPRAHTVLDLKQAGETYPFLDLCGSGLAFKLVQALIVKGNFGLPPGWEKWLLDMAGLATIADMVPLQGENRIIAKYGLLVLRKSPRLGLQRLCKKMNVRQHSLTEDDIAFMIAPRINAASRMDVPMEAFKLLTTTDEVEADVLALHLNKINDVRKGVVAAMAKEIKKRMSVRSVMREVIVMGNPEWKPALLGLAANSLVEEYGRPVFLWGREGEGVLKGSCRSDGTVDLVLLMERTKEVFIEFGGHKYSGGFSVVHEHIHTLEERLADAYKEVREVGVSEQGMLIDRKLSPEDVTWSLWNIVERLAPFGEGNPKPLFLFEDVSIESVRWFGKEEQHLEIKVERFDKPLPAIAFFAHRESFSELAKRVGTNDKVSIVGTIEKSTFGRSPELRLRIVDLA